VLSNDRPSSTATPIPHYSAYVLCCNNAHDVRRAVESVLAQRPAPTSVLVVDDGSTDESVASLHGLPVVIHRIARNAGRGFARAAATGLLDACEFILCCDATNALPPDFASGSLSWFADPVIGAVFGKIRIAEPRNAADRWRSRHVFQDRINGVNPAADTLFTGGTMVRRSAVMRVGNFDPRLRQGEDAELGRRLRAAGHRIVSDGRLLVHSHGKRSLAATLERYWRWNTSPDDSPSIRAYLRHINYSLRVLAAQDVADRDWMRIPISVLCPHYCFWRSVARRVIRKKTAPPA
jgi:GT2 family glycosyltransferase